MRGLLLLMTAVLSLSVLQTMIVRPLQQKKAEIESSMANDYALVAKYKNLMAGAEQSGEDLKKARLKLSALEKGIIDEKDTALASAKFQLKLHYLASASGMNVLTMRPSPAVDEGNYKVLPVHMEAEGGIKELSGFLKSIESSGMYLKLDEIVISQKDTKDQGQKGGLAIKLQVSGLARK